MTRDRRTGTPEGAPIRRCRLPLAIDAIWLVALATILAATLTPASVRDPAEAPPAPLAADLIRNVLLFVPLGVGLHLRGLAGAPILGLALALTASIEVAQLGIPGRAASVWDVLANTAGAALGIALAGSHRAWRYPSAAAATRLCLAAAALSVTILACRGLLAAPALPNGIWFADWTPGFGHLERYDGSLIDARIGELPLPHSRLGRDPEALRSVLAGDFELRLEAVAGAPPRALAPLFMIRVGGAGEVLLVGADGTDLVVRLRSQAQEHRFEPHGVRLPDALGHLRPGARFEVRITRAGDRIRTVLDGRSLPDRGPTLGDGWTLFLWDWLVPPVWHPVANASWIALLVLPMGYWARLRPASAVALAAFAASLAGLPLATPVLGTPVGEYLGAMTGLLVGLALSRLPRPEIRRRAG